MKRFDLIDRVDCAKRFWLAMSSWGCVCGLFRSISSFAGPGKLAANGEKTKSNKEWVETAMEYKKLGPAARDKKTQVYQDYSASIVFRPSQRDWRPDWPSASFNWNSFALLMRYLFDTTHKPGRCWMGKIHQAFLFLPVGRWLFCSFFFVK